MECRVRTLHAVQSVTVGYQQRRNSHRQTLHHRTIDTLRISNNNMRETTIKIRIIVSQNMMCTGVSENGSFLLARSNVTVSTASSTMTYSRNELHLIIKVLNHPMREYVI